MVKADEYYGADYHEEDAKYYDNHENFKHYVLQTLYSSVLNSHVYYHEVRKCGAKQDIK